ncbi:N-methyl-L-tryptophan oxidase [Gulosibacter sp. 10]|uniref:N-methyl-L-tryptophan oxidase n=1 Tax=Gulosibacter sp. 10 TaxID=1255570 RepID=UPI00097EFC2F|nr:N-methyl-L-tryptophan oxidase [Gulosibacter sp. 10]SJM66167.1 Monomeric sarcosine oxidase [Gulosibacter sp. 10]
MHAKPSDAEVVVIGLGAAGSHAARRIAETGVEVIGLEAEQLLHTRGAYAGESRLFRAAYHEGAEYVPLLLESREEWLELQRGGSREILRETGVLSIGSAAAPQMRRVRESLRHAGVAHRALSTAELREQHPQHGGITDEIGVLDLLGGVLRPEAAVAELQRRARLAGAELRGGQRVAAVEERGNRAIVRLGHGEELSARVAVLAPGVHAPALLPRLAPHLVIRPIGLTWFCPEDAEAFSPERFPAFIRDHGSTHLFGAPTLDGTLVKAGYDARLGTIADPAELPGALADEQREAVAADVHRLLPGLPPYVARESVHMDLFTADKRPVIGALGERIVVGIGFSGHGFKLAPAVGNALADLALARPTRHDLSAFSPDRFAG